MTYISSDTNIWLDFLEIGKLDLPFRLPYIYLMSDEMIEDELLNPPNFSQLLLEYGLQPTELSIEEYFLADELISKYKKPSKYDCIALAIAKNRHLTLLTGDNALRNAAMCEGVSVMGTLGILDVLYTSNQMNALEYKQCLMLLKEKNGTRIRLPKHILEERLKSLENG